MKHLLEQMILTELTKNARISYRELAKKLKVSTGTISAKISELERNRTILGYSAVLDHEKIGYGLTVVTEITVSRGKLVEMEKYVARNPHVLAVYDVTGQTDAIIISKFRTRKELSEFTKALLAVPYIERTNSHFVLNIVKEDFRMARQASIAPGRGNRKK